MSAEPPGPEGSWSDFKSLHFRLYYYKVLPCTKPFSHDWQHCPYTHPNDKARRRSPLQYPYAADMCPAMLQSGNCPKGVNCNMAHNLFEYHLHPDRYKTKMCRDGAKCSRVFCFFAHAPTELRAPFSATTAGAAATAAQQQAGGSSSSNSSSSSSSTSANTPVNRPTIPSSSRNGRALDAVAQQFAAALDSKSMMGGSMGGSSTNSAEMILGARSGSSSIGMIGPATRQVFNTPRASPVQQIHHGSSRNSSSMRCPMLSSSSSSSRLSLMQQYNDNVVGVTQQQQQQQHPGVFLGSTCDAAANHQQKQQQLQACYSVWNHSPNSDMHNTPAAKVGHALGVQGSNAVFDAQMLLPLGVTGQAPDVITSTQADVITSLALPEASTTAPWALQAARSSAMNFLPSSAVNFGVKYGAQAPMNMEMFAGNMMGAHSVVSTSSFTGADHIRLMYPNNAAAATAAAAATTGTLGQQQLQLFLQSGSTTSSMQTQQLGSTIGQCSTVLLPVTLLTATSAAAGAEAVQHTSVSPTVPLSMQGQQQQAIVPHAVTAGSTAAAGAHALPISHHWLV